MDYREALKRLYSLDFASVKLGLNNIRQLCRSLGDPQDRFVSIHIAGTNGKGSVCALLDSILRAEGYRVGRFTSPHLRDLRERIHVKGRPIPKQWIVDFVEAHWTKIKRNKYSFFEVITALAFDSYARAGCDIAVVEVGLGGRLDATNILNSHLSIITGIAFDHQHLLGKTYTAIAREKAGIIKTGTPLVTGPLNGPSAKVIAQIASDRQSPLFTAYELLSERHASQFLPRDDERWRSALAGDHQLANTSIAIAASALLNSTGVDISRKSIRRGIQFAHWPGRFQIIPGQPTIVFDAGHNQDGLVATARTWQKVFGQRQSVCVFATREDKSHFQMLSALSPVTKLLIGCPLPTMPGISRQDFMRFTKKLRIASAWEVSSQAAYRRAIQASGAHGLVLVAGSHFLVGDLIPAKAVASSDLKYRLEEAITRGDLIKAANHINTPH